ncbi:hypothetical protein [Endozoicomonas sp. SESOKO3]|uniref:hypothetical protein n=1 Tax=Endozoicomonas sp. SESOKO3 TaxID=2828744 RepID=UPI0021477CBD|nr:hypothetical protein [Endozoicomonas sp. SESOKO3]
MINSHFPAQSGLTNELLTQEKTIKAEKGEQNITDTFASQANHNINRTFKNDICATSVINQVHTPESTLEKPFPAPPTKLEHYYVSTHEGITWHNKKRKAYESSSAEALPEKLKSSKESSIIESSALLQAGCLIPKDKQWISFLQDFFRQIPIHASSMNRITSLQSKAGKIKEIVFLVEAIHGRGYGNLNLYIEFLRNFVRLSPGTLHLVRFSGYEPTLSNKLPNLLSGLPARDIDEFIIYGEHKLSSPEIRPDKLFGIPYIVEETIPTHLLSKNTLQIYTVWDSYKTSTKAPLFQITNYRWFPESTREMPLKNLENHLPIYPYEINKDTSTPELMKRDIANSLENPVTQGYDTEKLAQFFTELLQSAKENKIYLALSYHASGMLKHEYYNYTNAAKACFGDKPIIIIAPHSEKIDLSEKEKKELSDTGNIEFSTNYCLDFTAEKSLKDKVTVFEFTFLPKRLFELICYFSNIPIYAPGASTANIAQCLNKPYLGLSRCGHEIPTTGNPKLLGRWKVANSAFHFNPFLMQEVKSALLTMSKEQIELCDRKIKHDLWYTPENAHLELNKICRVITDEILRYTGLISTLIPHFFNGTDTSKIHEYTHLSADDRQSYFTRLLDEGRLPEFCQYVCDKSNEIVLDYMSQTTKPGDSFYELARALQQKALHPDNNMMLEVLERNLPDN